MTTRPSAQIATPCVQVCMIDRGTGLCLGCFRTGEEISCWSTLSAGKRDEIMAALPLRRLHLGPDLFGEA